MLRRTLKWIYPQFVQVLSKNSTEHCSTKHDIMARYIWAAPQQLNYRQNLQIGQPILAYYQTPKRKIGDYKTWENIYCYI
jgi:hypothetical protein